MSPCPDTAILAQEKKHTRSSPMGPAEHDEGGSLYTTISLGDGTKTHEWALYLSSGGSSAPSDMYLPAEVGEFFVDALKGHVWLIGRGMG